MHVAARISVRTPVTKDVMVAMRKASVRFAGPLPSRDAGDSRSSSGVDSCALELFMLMRINCKVVAGGKVWRRDIERRKEVKFSLQR
jgi:hypothetical protein